jgi:short-subunit dehydrogenase
VEEQVQRDATFRDRYGPWSVVLGASEGLGEAYAHEVARRGLDVIVAARRAVPVTTVARSLHDDHGVEAVPIVVDLQDADCLETLRTVTEALEVGLVIYNAAGSFVGPFLDEEPGHALEQVAINVSTLIGVCEQFGRPMVERGRGGIIVMSSGSGVAGTAGLAVYSATKAFQLTLAQALHGEWRGRGVHVLGVVGPAIDTPNFRRSFDHDPEALPHPPLPPAEVAREVIDALGREMEIMPGEPNRDGYRVLSAMPRVDQARLLSAAFTAASRVSPPARDPG